MERENLRRIVCSLQAMPGDIGGGVFRWTLKTRQLFARFKTGSAIGAGDLLELDRACEVARGIASILHGHKLEPWFDDCRAVIARDISEDDYYRAHYPLEAALRQLREKRADAEREYLRAFNAAEQCAHKEDA